jgi:hypothetical protein
VLLTNDGLLVGRKLPSRRKTGRDSSMGFLTKRVNDCRRGKVQGRKLEGKCGRPAATWKLAGPVSAGSGQNAPHWEGASGRLETKRVGVP